MVGEIPCPEGCDGGRVEFPSHFARGACDGEIIYRSEDCGECGGAGHLSETVCIGCDLTHPAELLFETAAGYSCAECMGEAD